VKNDSGVDSFETKNDQKRRNKDGVKKA